MSDETWMRAALGALVDGFEREVALRSLADDATFGTLRDRLDQLVPGIPPGDRGDNLVRALIALRVKFPPDEARAKLETNLAMRRPVTAADRP